MRHRVSVEWTDFLGYLDRVAPMPLKVPMWSMASEAECVEGI